MIAQVAIGERRRISRGDRGAEDLQQIVARC
jgi:hypothetical protein